MTKHMNFYDESLRAYNTTVIFKFKQYTVKAHGLLPSEKWKRNSPGNSDGQEIQGPGWVSTV